MKLKGPSAILACLILATWCFETKSFSPHFAVGLQQDSVQEDIEEGFEIVFPERVAYKGRQKRDLPSDSKIDQDELMSFKMEAFGKEFVVDVHQNKLLSSPYFTLRYFKENGELVQGQEAPPGCQYQGHVRGQEDSTVILDTCHGLSGLIEDDEGSLYIEPYQIQGNGAHRINKVKDKDWTHFSCGTSTVLNVTDSENNTTRATSRSKRRVEEYYKNYLKHLKPKKTRYTELMLIVDNVVFKKYKEDIADVKRRVFDLVNAVDMIYQKINIRVSLSALEVWTDRDHIPYVKNAGEDLNNLENHHLSKLAGVKHDCIHLLRGTMYDDFGGMAYRGEMCTRRSLGVNAWNYWGSLGPWLALSHEMGHNFNFDHDNLWPCKCLSPRGCVMGNFKTRVPGFSDCNLYNISSIDDSCLYNVPKKVLNPQCGNGKLEPGEECDCGAPEDCKVKDPCCKPNDCRLKKSSQCSDAVHKCCRNCQFSPLGTPCRKSTGQCDVPEVCTGKSGQCPPNDFIRDGKPCIGEEELLVGKYVENLKLTVLPKPITARHVKINPQYWERGLCMKFDLLGCSADSLAYASEPTSITSFNNLCVMPRRQSACSSDDGMEFVFKAKRECSDASSQFTLSSDGILKQHCSRKKICPSGGQAGYGVALVISATCDDEQSKFERTSGRSLRHVASGFCVHPEGGVVGEGVKLILWKGCDEERLAFNFLKQDCLVSLGLANSRTIPDASISSSSHRQGYPAHKGRLHSNKSWCAAHKDKKQFIKIDLGQVKKISAVIQKGSDSGDVTGFFLYFSQDGQQWTGYSSKPRQEAFCYNGKCSLSADIQCRDVWGPEAFSAALACYEKLNVAGLGFGFCNPVTKQACSSEHVACGQLQCYPAAHSKPVVDFGNGYTLEKCRAVTRKTGRKGTGLEMVKEGTVCGKNKICVANHCTPVDQLTSTPCPVANYEECAGNGTCTRNGKCNCDKNLDPNTACQRELEVRNGIWGPWSEWTNCTRTCGGGIKSRYRFCNNPAPAHGGLDCQGTRIEEVSCNTQSCPEVHSCHHLLSLGKRLGIEYPDGVYTINPDKKGPVKTYCDMSRDGGGWTLLVTSHSHNWRAKDITRKNPDVPSLDSDYSILHRADDVKRSVEWNWFEYRIEANERGRWGGIWRAPREYTFVATNNKQTNVELLKKFDNWTYDDYGVERRMPWIFGAKLTTSSNATGDRQWGTLIANSKIFYPAPWLDGNDLEQHPVNIWYWVRERRLNVPRSCMEIQLRRLQSIKPPEDGLFTIKPGDHEVQTFCQFSKHGGGWTLLLTSATERGWTRNNVKSRHPESDPMTSDFSMLKESNKIINHKHFQFRIEEAGESGWEQIFAAGRGCSLVGTQTDKPCAREIKSFGKRKANIKNGVSRQPYISTSGNAILTTADDERDLNGAIVVTAPGKRLNRQSAGLIRIWVREGTGRSCFEVKLKARKGTNKEVLKDGFYMIEKDSYKYFPVFCDMTSEEGAYTLLVTSASNGWRKNEVKFKNPTRPSITDDYSILGYGDVIKSLSGGTKFRYRLEARTRGHWGGVWEAPINYSFVSETNQQTEVTLVKKFDQWEYSWESSLEKRMPWLGARQSLLTTSTHSDYSDWGSIISEKRTNDPAPWLYVMPNPGLIWYWVNEDDCDGDRRPVNGGLSEWSAWSKCEKLCVKSVETRVRACSNPAPRCGGETCTRRLRTREERECMVCPKVVIKGPRGFCLQPESANCNPGDNTRLVYTKDPKCSKDYMAFIYSDDILTHLCSGKHVCPQGGIASWGTLLVISSTCQSEASKFQRTSYKTLKHKVSEFCVHPYGGPPREGLHTVMWKDACRESKLKLDLVTLVPKGLESPIRSHGGFCLQPESASCSPADNTRLIYHRSARCSEEYMLFSYKDQILTHACSGKNVCPQGGTADLDSPLIISSSCQSEASKFVRTSHKTLRHKASGFCVHPHHGRPKQGIHAVTWNDDCREKRLKLELYKLRGPG